MEEQKLPLQEESAIANKIEDAIINEENTIPYSPMSKLDGLGTSIPLALAGETLAAQYSFRKEIGNVDEFLVEKLKYTSRIALSNALAAEQADAVAMAIYQFERGKGFILADMAGIGKGRVNAALLRYAYVNGMLPVFVTEAPNLFSAIYRDIKDIGGLGTKNGKPHLGYPLILNGYESGGVEKTYDENGKLVRIKKPAKTSIIDRVTGAEVIVAPKKSEIKQIVESKNLPKQYDYILLTYSQLAGASGRPRVEYLSELFESRKREVIVAMDEVHNASGAKSDVGKSMQFLMTLTRGVLFSSATFSKRPDNMYLYALKTDVQESPVGTEELIEVIQKGGERLTENLASNIVLSKQMLRRQKTFENCDVIYEYMSEQDKAQLYENYDNTIKLFLEINDFFENGAQFRGARAKSIERFAKANGVKLAPPMVKGEKQKDYLQKNIGKYRVSSYTIGGIGKLQFSFIETLLFSLKADFVANNILAQLTNNQLDNITTKDKTVFKSNRKPVVAIRNTLESVYQNLDLQVGDTIDKADFSLYVYSIAKSAATGTIRLKEIVSEKDEEKGKGKVVEDSEFEILESDYEDGGEAYRNLLKKIENIKLNIPLSPIDHIINKIEEYQRPDWDKKFNNSPTYKVGEVTGRKFRLVKKGEKEYQLMLNQRDKNKASAFKKFNDGVYDVLLINESGSTGEDAHSSTQFKDTRPRVMIIHQVELDVNTEVQKRGRINRTGMVNYPSYVYAVSRIPSEIRRLIMLTRKLRSLDAGTTGNQKQSAKLSEIKDKNGNPIEDLTNKYGDEVLEEYMSVEEHRLKYEKYMPDEEQLKMMKFTGGKMVDWFFRKMELATAEEQDYLYDSLNIYYIDYITKLKEEGLYDLETETKDLRASIKNRVEISQGENTSPFNASVYLEDDYVMAENKPYPKERVEQMIEKFGDGKTPEQAYQDFLNDFVKNYREVQIPAVVAAIRVPDYKDEKDPYQRDIMKAEYDMQVEARLFSLKEEHEEIYELLKIFKPGMPCLTPTNPDDCYEVDDFGIPKTPKDRTKSRFVGVKLLTGAKDKYSPMNIELVFCQLRGKPKVSFKPTKKGRTILEWIKVWIEGGLSRIDLVEISNWTVDPNLRELMKVYTGNILSSYNIASNLVDTREDLYSKRIEFLRFTTVDSESLRLGVRVYFNRIRYQEIDTDNYNVTLPLNSPTLINAFLAIKGYRQVNLVQEANIYVEFRWGTVYFYIFGGTMRGGKRGEAKYFNPLYGDMEFLRLLDSERIPHPKTEYNYTAPAAQKSVKVAALNIMFDLSIPSIADKMQVIFNYIYEKKPVLVTISQSGGVDVISKQPDLFVPKQEGQDEEQLQEIEGVEYKYFLAIPYEAAIGKLNSYSKFKRHEKVGRGYGTIFLNRRATALEATTYSIYPLEPTAKTMIGDTLGLLSENDKIKFSQDLKKRIKDGQSNLEIALYVFEIVSAKVLSTKNIFGFYADDLDFIGQLFKDYTEGKIEEIKLPEPKKIEDLDEVELPLTFDTAQDFLISMLSKTK